MRLKGDFDDRFLSIKKVGDYIDIHEFDYDNQVYLAACRFNASSTRNKGRRVSARTIRTGKSKFFRVFLIEKNQKLSK